MRAPRNRMALTVVATVALMAGATPGSAAIGGSTAVADVGASDYSDPMADAEFFGRWDGDTWAVAPRLDYTVAGLAPVRDAVRAGDYPAAEQALLDYFRNRPASDAGWFSREAVPGALELTPDHIWTLGDGEVYQSTIAFGTEPSAVSTDVTESVHDSLQTGTAGFFLMSRTKDAVTAYVHSRRKGSGKPTLRVESADGSVTSLTSTHDTHIWAGYPQNPYGDKYLLQVHDEGPGPFADATRKAYLQFDLAGIPDVANATLTLTGYADQPKSVMVYANHETFDEATRTWANTVQNTFSWQGDPEGFDWIGPVGSDKEYGTQLPRFYFAGPLALAYADTGDEAYAETLLGLVTDFIVDADSYESPYGAGSFPDSLSAARRLHNWLASYEILRGSDSLDADTNTEILKALYKSGAYLEQAVVGTPNKMLSQKLALLHAALGFGEFAGSSRWRDNALDFLATHVRDTTHADGGYVEATGGYARGYAATYPEILELLNAHDVEFVGEPDLRRFAHFLMDQSLPNGFGPAYGDSASQDWRSTLRRLGDALDDDALRYVGTGGSQGTEPDHTSAVYPDTRVAISRSGWDPDARHLRLNVDRGNHSHPDELAVTTYAYGRELLPDMGTFTYSDDPRSQWLRRSTESKNTVEVDDQPQNSKAPGAITHQIINPRFDRFGANTEGSAGARHSRSVFSLHAGLWIVSDRLDPADESTHRYEQNWHFLPDADVTLDAGSKMVHTRFADGANLTVVPADATQLDAAIRDGYYSPEFYHVQDAKYASYVQRTAGSTVFDTVLVPSRGAADAQVSVQRLPVDSSPSYRTTALDIGFGDGRNATYYKAWTTRAERTFGDYAFDGKLLYTEDATDGSLRSIALTSATTLRRDGTVLIDSPAVIPDMAVDFGTDGVVRIHGESLTPDTDPATAIAITAPDATEVHLNGTPVPHTRSGDQIYAAA